MLCLLARIYNGAHLIFAIWDDPRGNLVERRVEHVRTRRPCTYQLHLNDESHGRLFAAPRGPVDLWIEFSFSSNHLHFLVVIKESVYIYY
jgi:hypothetical protein